MMNKPYQPIACSLHDEYEIAIMHKKHLKIKWLDEEGLQHVDEVLPKDILLKNREEFLIVETSTLAKVEIRLDWITILA